MVQSTSVNVFDFGEQVQLEVSLALAVVAASCGVITGTTALVTYMSWCCNSAHT
jgi:hypothetical protein